MTRPLCIDLFCGLGGWTEGFLAEGWDVIGFDIEQHVYGSNKYPAQLVLQDVLTLHGSQFKDADCIVASPPCQFFSYTSMPWTRAKYLAAQVREDPTQLAGRRSLFDACFRLQKEACEASGRFIPLVVENVVGAQKWVGKAAWHYGSYYLWGDVPAVMPMVAKGRMKSQIPATGKRFDERIATTPEQAHALHYRLPAQDGTKVGGLDWNKRIPGQAFNGHAERAIKNSGGSWFNIAHNTTSGKANNARDKMAEGIKVGGGWFHDSSPGTIRSASSKSTARKAASAAIAKIPFALARHIAQVYDPRSAAA